MAWLENLEQFAIDVILERRHGVRATLLRGLLYALSFIYERIVQLRLFLYRKRIFRERTLGCLVISIGNLTVGGTGKTPIVEKIARALQIGGRRVAILSRGYKSVPRPTKRRLIDRIRRRDTSPPRVVSDGKSLLLDSLTAGDEPYMLANNLKDVIVLVDKDRVKSGLHAIRQMKADTLLLDDGLQYLHLKHRLDIVLIDRQAPFGNEFLLPRGTLREPPRNLRRASYIFITKSTGEPNDKLIERIRRYNRTAEIIECAHQPLYLQNVVTASNYRSKVCAILTSARFAASPLRKALRKVCANSARASSWRNGISITTVIPRRNCKAFINRCIRRDLEMIVTTEKDAVRFPRLTSVQVPIYFLRVEIEILSGHESWEHCVGAHLQAATPALAREIFRLMSAQSS